MRTVTVSRIDTPLPILSQGTWEMGTSRRDLDNEVAALRHGFRLGMTLIDTAEMYAAGGAEEVVGEAIKGMRDQLFIESKVLPENASRAGVAKAAERSLKRMGIEHMDLYLLHWPGSHPLEETIAGFEDLVQAGKIRHWGVSNFDLRAMQEVERLAPGRCACNQVLYNLARRGPEWGLIKFCQQQGILFQPYSPLDQGKLGRPQALVDVAQRHGVTPEQVALAWAVRLPGCQTIPKSSRPERVEQNAQAADLQLTDEDLTALDAAFPRPPQDKPFEWR
jgi:diketogulonate reductase-like aldo/keto reductase